MDNPNDVELTVSKAMANSVNRDNISIQDLDQTIKLTDYEPDQISIGYSKFRDKNILKKNNNDRFTFCYETNELDFFPKQNNYDTFSQIQKLGFSTPSQRFVGQCSIGNDEKLNSSASNLSEVIHLLDSPGKEELYERFNDYVSTMFPQFGSVSTQILSKRRSLLACQRPAGLGRSKH